MKFAYLPFPPFDNIYIDQSVCDSEISRNIRAAVNKYKIYEHTNIIEITDYKEFLLEIQNDISGIYDKKTLLIYPEKGQFIHHCPGSDGVICCRYFVLDFGMNCPYDCHYCYLQTYAKIPILTVAGNVENLLDQLAEKVSGLPEIHWRIGTGEYTDSLALENLTGLGKMLVERFSTLQNATLELKTKSIEIDSLLNLDHRGNTVISWSINPKYIVDHAEYYCTSLEERLQAAQKVIHSGYQVAFHFDPIFYYEGWGADYKTVVDLLFSRIPHNKIRWISMGTFRYTPGLKEKLRLRYPDEIITRSEMILAPDHKFRYIAPVRAKIYKYLSDCILSHDPEMMIYLCMETKPTWKRAFGKNLSGPNYLDAAFEKRRQSLLKTQKVL